MKTFNNTVPSVELYTQRLNGMELQELLRVGNGDVTWRYLVAALQFQFQERQMYVMILAPRGPHKFWLGRE